MERNIILFGSIHIKGNKEYILLNDYPRKTIIYLSDLKKHQYLFFSNHQVNELTAFLDKNKNKENIVLLSGCDFQYSSCGSYLDEIKSYFYQETNHIFTINSTIHQNSMGYVKTSGYCLGIETIDDIQITANIISNIYHLHKQFLIPIKRDRKTKEIRAFSPFE